MSWQEFDDNCPGCRPCLIDAKTGEKLAQDSDIMRQVNKVWETATPQEKRAFHNVMCNNSREPMDMALATGLINKITEAGQSN